MVHTFGMELLISNKTLMARRSIFAAGVVISVLVIHRATCYVTHLTRQCNKPYPPPPPLPPYPPSRRIDHAPIPGVTRRMAKWFLSPNTVLLTPLINCMGKKVGALAQAAPPSHSPHTPPHLINCMGK